MRESAEQIPRFTHTIDPSVPALVFEGESASADIAAYAERRTSDGWKEDAEEHQETVGAAHDCGCVRVYSEWVRGGL